jgi:hypothetical protein
MLQRNRAAHYRLVRVKAKGTERDSANGSIERQQQNCESETETALRRLCLILERVQRGVRSISIALPLQVVEALPQVTTPARNRSRMGNSASVAFDQDSDEQQTGPPRPDASLTAEPKDAMPNQASSSSSSSSSSSAVSSSSSSSSSPTPASSGGSNERL